MEFHNEFTVSADVATTWATLTDLERIAPCLPGAALEEIDGDDHKGRVRVKVGPVAMTYQGTARIVEADPETRTARIVARGRESKGAGNASADITAVLTESGSGTHVRIHTELEITGKPAQFGKSVMQEVGTLIIDQFAGRLEQLISGGGGAADMAGGSHASASQHRAGLGAGEDLDDALDIASLAGSIARKHIATIGLGILAIALVWRVLRK